MDSQAYLQWQQWENRVQKWLEQLDDELDLSETYPPDRIILVTLAVKYQLEYRDIGKKSEENQEKEGDLRKSQVKLSKSKTCNVKNESNNHQEKQKLFNMLTNQRLTSEKMNTEKSAEEQEFTQLCEWHGWSFLNKFFYCLSQLISTMISETPAYQELLHNRPITSPVATIDNKVFHVDNDGHLFLSVDMKSANFSMLQYIRAIDPQRYSTWSEFLTTFVGSRPIITESKKLRMICLGKLPKYYKLQALWTHYTATIYKTVCSCFDKMDVEQNCVSLVSDEMVFHLDVSIQQEKAIELIEYVRKCLARESPNIRFSARLYRLQKFHWQNKHMCFGRIFIGPDSEQFDLKCVPDKKRNLDQAVANFRRFFDL